MTVSMSFRVLINVLNVISVFEGKLIQVKLLTVEDLLQDPVAGYLLWFLYDFYFIFHIYYKSL